MLKPQLDVQRDRTVRHAVSRATWLGTRLVCETVTLAKVVNTQHSVSSQYLHLEARRFKYLTAAMEVISFKTPLLFLFSFPLCSLTRSSTFTPAFPASSCRRPAPSGTRSPWTAGGPPGPCPRPSPSASAPPARRRAGPVPPPSSWSQTGSPARAAAPRRSSLCLLATSRRQKRKRRGDIGIL